MRTGGGSGGTTYYIAVSSAAVSPTILDATFQLTATDPFVRLEPVNSGARLIDDRIGSTGVTTASDSEQIFPGTTPVQLNTAAVPYTLADVVLYVSTQFDEVFTINPFTGQIATFVTDPTGGAGLSEFLADASANSDLFYTDIAMRDDGRMYTFRRGAGDNNTAQNNGTYTQFDPGTADTMDNLGAPLVTFDIDPANPITAATATSPANFAFTTLEDDPGVMINAMGFSSNTFGFSSVDGRSLFVVGNRAPGTLVGVDNTGTIPEDPEEPDGDVVDVQFITQTQNLLFRLNPNTGAPLASEFANDFYTNEDFFPPRGDVTHTAYYAYTDSGTLAGPGTVVVPRGTLNTGVFLAGVPGSAVSDTDTFSIYTSTGTTRVHLTTFEFDTGDGVEPGNFTISFSTGDSAAALSAKIVNVINSANMAVPYANPAFSAPVSAQLQGDNVKIFGSRFADVSDSLKSDGFNLIGGSNAAWLASSTDITGLAFLDQTGTSGFSSLPALYAVGENGGIYEVIGKDDFGFGGYAADDNATLRLLNIVEEPVFAGGTFFFEDRVHFTGLTQGPSNVENGRYANILFASDDLGRIWAFDADGQPAPIFVNGQTYVSMLPAGIINSPFTVFHLEGLAFSPLDYNLWHVTDTRDNNEGHGITRTFDFDFPRNPADPEANPPAGGNSFYFALEDPRFLPDAYERQPGAVDFIPTNQNGQESLLLSGNQALFGSYNLPGGAYGSLISAPLSLKGYTSADLPTLYFNYAADTDAAVDASSGNDGLRVYASTDGANWVHLATNSHDNLSPGLSASGTLSELFDPAGQESTNPRGYQLNDNDQPLPTALHTEDLAGDGTLTPVWRQARVDLSDFAGQENILLRFDFSSAGSMGIGDLLQGGVYLATVEAGKLADRDSFSVDDETFTFRQGFTLLAPTGGGTSIDNGETFTINGPVDSLIFEFTRPGVPLTVGDVAVVIGDDQTPERVADVIYEAIRDRVAGVTPVRDDGFSLQVPPGGPIDLQSGETITINGRSIELRNSGAFGGSNLAVPIDAFLAVQLPALGGAALVNGETFTINGTTFELRRTGTPAPGVISIPYTSVMLPLEITTAIVSAINGAGIGVFASQFGRDVPGDSIFLSGATTGLLSDNHSLLLRAFGSGVTSSAQSMATALADVIEAAGIGVTPVQNGTTIQLVGATSVTQTEVHSILLMEQDAGSRVQLVGATSVPQSLSPGLIVEGSALPGTPATTDVFYQQNWSAEAVANAVATALDATFTTPGNFDDPTTFTSSKVLGSTLRIWGHTIGSSGPLAASATLAGQTGRFFTPITVNNSGGLSINRGELREARSRNGGQGHDPAASEAIANNHEGFYIDDIVVGFAARGEMVTGHFNSAQEILDTGGVQTLPITGVNTFMTLPGGTIPVNTVTTGPFQLNIRRGTEYAFYAGGVLPYISLFETRSINDRLAQGFTLIAPPESELLDGLTFAITLVDGRIFTFEFDTDFSWGADNYRVLLETGDSARDVALSIRDAINDVPADLNFDVQAGVKVNGSRVNLFGGVAVDPGPLGLDTYDNLGDLTPTRAQGYTIVQGNRISDSLQAGVIVRPSVTFIDEVTFEIGTPGHTYSVINLPVLNVKELVPGVAIKENLIIAGGQNGIVFSGSPNTDIAHAAPFGRIINNTVVDTPSGIQIINNASPTLLNNIIANTETAIRVDSTSRSTVIGTTVYKDNEDNLLGDIQTNAIFLASGAPLFVDTSKRNYYLLKGSEAIDSSLNSLPERADMQAVLSPLGISPSPIKASEFDLLGQLRVDDPTVQSPPGLGSNVFKDRGAVERADVKGPFATLVDPIDNDAALLDRNPAVHDVILVGQKLAQFTIQLNDGGLGVDDSTVGASQFVIERTVDGITTTLTPDVDYTIGIETTDDIVLVTPAEGVWINGTYTITIDNSDEGIKDLAGDNLDLPANNLQPNRPSGLTQFIIELTDTPVSSWQNPENPLDVNADGFVSGLDALLIINRLLLGMAGPLPAIPIVPPFIDTTGDGSLSPRDALLVINFLSQPPAAPATAETVVLTAEPLASEPPSSPATSSVPSSPATSSAPSSNSATSAIAFGVTVGSSSPVSLSFASASIDVTSTNWVEPASGSTSLVAPRGAEQAAAADDVWGSDEWDASTDEWDGIVSELFDESEEQNSVFV